MLALFESGKDQLAMALFGKEWAALSTSLATGIGLLVAMVAWYAWKKLTTNTKRSPADASKCVLVTGCDSGFGKLLAHRLLDEGYTVVAACYTQDGAMDLDKHASSTNKSVVTVVADLMTKEGRTKVVGVTTEVCKSKRGGLYSIVNNAGLVLPGCVEWLPQIAYEKSMNLNFHAPSELTYELLPLLKKKKGRVVNVTSVDGFISLPTNAAYNASKHALEAWSDCLRIEMLDWGVKVVVIQPSTMRTPLAEAFADRYRDVFLDADPKRKAQYGDKKWIAAVHEQTVKGMEDLMGDPQVGVNDLLSALQLEDPPTRIKSGTAAKYVFQPLSWLPDKTRDRLLSGIMFAKGLEPQGLRVPIPPANKISHVSIKVRNLAKAVAFYETFGFSTVGKAEGGKQFLKGGNHRLWKPLVLLVEDPDMAPRENCYEIGQTRLCLYTTNLDKDVADLKAKGMEVCYPIAEIGMARIATYKDPDNFVVYLIQFKLVLGWICKAIKYYNTITEPSTFHWTVNVHDSAKVNKMLEGIGFKAVSDQNKDQVGDGLLPAFGLSPDTTVIEHIRLQSLPDDHFVVTTMEWVEPKATKNGQELSNGLSIAVENVEEALQKAKDAGLVVKGGATTMHLPYYGEVEVGTAYLEEDSNPIEFVAY